MRTTQVDKLYDKLTLHERASLGFEAMARQDHAEMDAILKSVPQQNYRIAHHEYRNRLLGIDLCVAEYGLHFWRNCTLGLLTKDPSMAYAYFVHAASAEAAMQKVCEEIKLDIKTVRKCSECLTPPPFSTLKVNPELVEEYFKLFMMQIKFAEKSEN